MLERVHGAVVETEVRLVVHAIQALHDRLLELVDHFRALASLGIDLVDSLVVDLHLEVLRPAAVTAQPAARASLWTRTLHGAIVWARPARTPACKAPQVAGLTGVGPALVCLFGAGHRRCPRVVFAANVAIVGPVWGAGRLMMQSSPTKEARGPERR